MEITELMKIRFKVIADYPINPVQVGFIVEDCSPQLTAFYETMPHLFKKLEWWEERKNSEMPQYVRAYYKDEKIEMNDVYKIISWDLQMSRGLISMSSVISLNSMVTPATEEEYNEYQRAQAKIKI